MIRRIEDQLGRFGIAGHVELTGTILRLVGHGRTIVVSFEDVELWSGAAPDQRAREVDRIVRELVRARRAASQPASPRSGWLDWLRPAAILALAAAGTLLAWRWLGAPAHDAVVAASLGKSVVASGSGVVGHTSHAPPPPASEQCQRVQARVAMGGSISPLDVDGWVVELMLLARDPALVPASPRLDAFFVKRDESGAVRRMAWHEDETLNALDSKDSFVLVSADPLVDVVAGTRSGVRITWSGKYAAQYFDETNRLRLQHLAAALYESTQADFGALYARCELGWQHQGGSWFRSRDLPTATLSMLAAMGLYAEVSHVEGADPRTASRLEQRRVWDQLVDRSAKLNRERVTLALSEDGGMVASRPGQWQTITFPFQDANRATRASLKMARILGVAPRH